MAKDTMKIRLLVVYRMLMEGKKITVRQIMRRLEDRYDISVDRKTIYDDIREIDRLVPVEVIPGCNGGYRLMDVLGGCE